MVISLQNSQFSICPSSLSHSKTLNEYQTTGLARSAQRYSSTVKNDDEGLRLAIIRLAKQYGRYGYRKITQLLRMEGWGVITRRLNGCSEKKGCNCHIVIKSGNGCIIKTVLLSAYDLDIPVTYGASTSFTTSLAMGAATKC